MESKELIQLFLPQFVSKHFDVKKLETREGRIDIYLDEQKTTPKGLTKRPLISHGYTPPATIQDFPIRGKAVFLHIRRRKWLDTETNTIHSQTYDLAYDGTQLTEEFVAFLKATN